MEGAPDRGWVMLAVAPIVAIVVVIAGYVMFLQPLLTALAEVRAQRASALVALPALTTDIARAEKVRAAVETIPEAQLHTIDGAVPGGEDTPGLFTAIDAAAQNAGIAIASMDVTREEPPKDIASLAGHRVLTIGISLRHVDYARLKAFLDVLASSARIMDVLSVQFAAQSLTATVRARAYTMD